MNNSIQSPASATSGVSYEKFNSYKEEEVTEENDKSYDSISEYSGLSARGMEELQRNKGIENGA